jgi:O-6-methylguanine DNA methyltransferase
VKSPPKKTSVEISVPTPHGKFIACYGEKGLTELDFPKVGTPRRGVRSNSLRADRRTPRRGVPTQVLRWHRATVTALESALAGRIPQSSPPLDLSNGTAFQRSVWRVMQKIPPGQTRSYGEIAQAIGKPEAVRAVGGACGANPIPILVPCHRVLAAGGKLGGFSGGLKWKRELLAREGIRRRLAG